MFSQKVFQPIQYTHTHFVAAEAKFLLTRRQFLEQQLLLRVACLAQPLFVLTDRVIDCGIDLQQASQMIGTLEGMDDRVGQFGRNSCLALHFSP